MRNLTLVVVLLLATIGSMGCANSNLEENWVKVASENYGKGDTPVVHSETTILNNRGYIFFCDDGVLVMEAWLDATTIGGDWKAARIVLPEDKVTCTE